MSKAAVIFWSQTGNTEQMANAIADGIREGGMEVDVLNVADTTPADAVKYAKIALGCPAMGAEVLEETEFDPFFTELEKQDFRPEVALFGSYGWGDGEGWLHGRTPAVPTARCSPVRASSAAKRGRRRACAVQEAGCYAGRLIPGVTGGSALGRQFLSEPRAALPDRSTTPEHK